VKTRPAEPPRFEEDVATGPVELVPGLWIRRPQDRPIRGSLTLYQGPAFGSGTHPTTRLAARALRVRSESRPFSVLDVGCGSGVLSLVAAKLGATRVVAIDKDRTAVALAARNAQQNKLAIHFAAATPEAIDGTFDLVVANLWVDELLAAGAALSDRLGPGGLLYATGAPLTSAKRMLRELAHAKLRPLGLEAERNWAGALFLKI
jgi:ribosomal protein L11 methyltransferase